MRCGGRNSNSPATTLEVTSEVMSSALFWFAPLTLLTSLLVSCSTGERPAMEGAVDLGPGVHLFVDDFLIQERAGVWRTMNRPFRASENPVLRPDRPWEGYLVLQPGTVIYDQEERLFKLWYNTMPSRARPDVEQFICYATSPDGVSWNKPNLGLISFKGSKANNIVLRWCKWNHSVIKDLHDPDPERRYKIAYWQSVDEAKRGIWVAFSPDGIHWTQFAGNPVVPMWASGDTFSVMQDPETGHYWLYHKTRPGLPAAGPDAQRISRLISQDFTHWEADELVLEPGRHDPPDTEFYGLSAFPYGDQYLGFLWVHHTYSQMIDVQMTSSRDGVDWNRVDRGRTFLLPGYVRTKYKIQQQPTLFSATFDSAMVYPSGAPVLHDDQLWIYYSGFNNLHNTPSMDHAGQVGLARLRVDGFCSLDATSEGYILTRPLRLDGSSLRVNVELLSGAPEGADGPWRGVLAKNPAGNGYLRVEVLDEEGHVIPGYEASNCRLLEEEGVYWKVSWQGGISVRALRGKTIQLRFILSQARFYGFRIASDQ